MKVWVAAAGLILTAMLGACTTAGPSAEQSRRAALYNMQAGAEYLQKGNLPAAKEKLEKAVRQDPKSAKANEMYALLLQRLGHPEEAEKHYRLAMKLNPEDSRTHNNFAIFLCRQNKIQEAEEHFLLAVKDPLYQTPWVAYTNAGVCVLQDHQEEKAEQYFQNALAENPEFLDALSEMALLMFNQAQYRRANAFIQRYHDVRGRLAVDNPAIKPSTAPMLWLCIRTERNLRNHVEAERCGHDLVRLYPRSEETQLFLESRGHERR